MTRKLLISLTGAALVALLQTQAAAPHHPATRPSPGPTQQTRPARSNETQSFFFVTDKEIYSGAFKMTMRCPAHAFRSPQWALEHLKRIREDNPSREIRVWACRANQMPTLRMFAPVSDVIGTNPFVVLNKESPKCKVAIWPSFDHPVLNSVREIRLAAPNVRMFACISVEGQRPLFPKRGPSLAELRWMAYAVIGGNYQGICWRPDRGKPPISERLAELEQVIKPFAADLAAARPVDLVSAPSGQPVTALLRGKHLFVVLLSPEYMLFRDNKPVAYPLAPAVRTGRITVPTNGQFRVVSAATISGLPQTVKEDGLVSYVSYRLADSGEILVLNLDRSPEVPSSQPSQGQLQGAKR